MVDGEIPLAAVATAASGALVAEMTKAGWGSVRRLAARIFRRAGEEEEARQLRRLDADQAQIDSLDQGEVEERWRRRLLTLAEDYPEVLDDLKQLASRTPADRQGGVTQSATGNSGPVIQVGGDNFGELHTGEGRS
jgi:FMN phosphatase YigB (HAD superfamily)